MNDFGVQETSKESGHARHGKSSHVAAAMAILQLKGSCYKKGLKVPFSFPPESIPLGHWGNVIWTLQSPQAPNKLL